MMMLFHYIAVILVIAGMMSMTAFATSAPQQQEQSPPAATNSTTYTDDTGFTVNLPPGWTPIDWDNTSQEARQVAVSQLKETLVEFCPIEQSSLDNAMSVARCNDHLGSIQVSGTLTWIQTQTSHVAQVP
jgi:hypothetical protein